MSEGKLYAIKNEEGKWLNQYCFWGPEPWAKPDKDDREKDAKHYGGHVVTFVEEPEKVLLTKEQAGIVDYAHGFYLPASHISRNSGEDEQELLMNAYVNGYTVEKEKKYNVKVPHTKDVWYFKTIEAYLLTISDKKLRSEFTEAEIEHYGLQDCEKEEVTDNAD